MSRRQVVSLAGIAHSQDAIAFFPKSETDCVGMAFSRKATATTSVSQVATRLQFAVGRLKTFVSRNGAGPAPTRT